MSATCLAFGTYAADLASAKVASASLQERWAKDYGDAVESFARDLDALLVHFDRPSSVGRSHSPSDTR